MEDITTDKLKAVAEYMGYEVIMRSYNLVHVYADEEWSEYNPLTNAEQDRELEIKLLNLGAVTDKVGETCWIRIKNKGIHATGKTPSEARLRAAIALVESSDGR